MINTQITYKNIINTPLLCIAIIGVLLLTGCENDLREVSKIENIQQEEAVDISKHVRVVLSDSAHVKAELSGPEMRVYHDTTMNKNQNREFPKGVQIIFFDDKAVESQRIKSDYGIQKAKEGIIQFKRNVVITLADGSIIKTEEFFYDEKKKMYYNHVPITFEMKDSRANFQAESFTSDVDFKNIVSQKPTGYYVTQGNSLFPGLK